MKITLESTSSLVNIEGVECRIWEGSTEGGVPLVAFIVRTAVRSTDDPTQFDRELKQKPALREATEAWPMRMIL